MNKHWLLPGILICMVLIGSGSLLWAWQGGVINGGTISRGFFVGGALAVLFGMGSFRTSYGFVQQNAPSYSTAYYNTLKDRSRLMFADMAEHSGLAMILLSSGLLSIVLGLITMWIW